MANEEKQQQDEAGKIQKNFDSAIKSLTALFGGKEKLKFNKSIPKDDVSNIMDELFKEDREAKKIQAKKDFRDIVEKYALMNKELREAEAQLKSVREKKMKEFTEAAKTLLKRIEGLSELEKDFYEGIKNAVSSGNPTT